VSLGYKQKNTARAVFLQKLTNLTFLSKILNYITQIYITFEVAATPK
jgi:hypothetical protein